MRVGYLPGMHEHQCQEGFEIGQRLSGISKLLIE
jgi:hypothetical protein